MKRLGCAALVSLTMSFSAFAQDVGFQNLNEDDFKRVVGDFSANSLHTSVSGASPLGDVFGFEVGLVGGMTNTPEIQKLVQEVSANNEAKKIPHAALIGILTVPFAITGEVGIIPEVGSDGFKYSMFSAAAKWTPTALFTDWPFNLAVKLHTTKAKMEFSEVVSSVNTNYDFENSLVGLTALASMDFIFVEPYIGIGTVNAKGDLSATGAAVFDPSYTASTSASEEKSSTLIQVGAEFKLLIAKAGLEYTSAFDTERYSAKLSFFF